MKLLVFVACLSAVSAKCAVTCQKDKSDTILVTHPVFDRNEQHRCYLDGDKCECLCIPKCKTQKIAGTYRYFNSGNAKGCEHRHHYLYDYKGSDCVWTSEKQPFMHPHAFEGAFVRFQTAEYGNLEDNDYIQVELKFCDDDKCAPWQRTVKLRDDIMGWRWTTINGANVDGYFNGNKDWRAYQTDMDQDHHTVQIRVRMRSSHNYHERHILDNMEVYGSCQ